jgi:hypothetical protein
MTTKSLSSLRWVDNSALLSDNDETNIPSDPYEIFFGVYAGVVGQEWPLRLRSEAN